MTSRLPARVATCDRKAIVGFSRCGSGSGALHQFGVASPEINAVQGSCSSCRQQRRHARGSRSGRTCRSTRPRIEGSTRRSDYLLKRNVRVIDVHTRRSPPGRSSCIAAHSDPVERRLPMRHTGIEKICRPPLSAGQHHLYGNLVWLDRNSMLPLALRARYGRITVRTAANAVAVAIVAHRDRYRSSW